MDERGTLRLAKEAIERGDKASARVLLREAIQTNPRSEVAWLWLSAIVDDPDRERQCLERVLAINPDNAVAQQHLERFRQEGAPPWLAAVPDQPQSTSPSWSTPFPTESQPEPTPAATPELQPDPPVLELYGAGLVLSMISPTFYWHAARRRASSAVYFLVLYGLVLTTVQTLGVSHTFGTMGREVERAFASGAFPRLTISRGQAAVQGPDPFVREFEGGIVIVDTTGRYGPSALRSDRYASGFLLTRTTLYSLNRGELQGTPLSQIQPVLGDPFVLDAQIVRRALDWLQIGVFVALLIAHTLGGLIAVAILAIVVRAVASRFWTGIPYGAVFTTGAYATVPATYGAYALRRLGIGGTCGLQTLLLVVVWAVGLAAALAERGDGILRGGRSLRSWRALVGVPMLLVLALDAVYAWPRGGIPVVGVTLFTLLVLAFVGLWPIMGKESASSHGASSPRGA